MLSESVVIELKPERVVAAGPGNRHEFTADSSECSHAALSHPQYLILLVSALHWKTVPHYIVQFYL